MHPTRRRIIFFLLTHDKCKLEEIAIYTHRAKSSTTSFQLKSLKYAGIISVLWERYKRNEFHRLKNKERIVSTASKYKIRL